MLKKYLLFCVSFFCFGLGANAQVNLVPNFSFEEYSNCPYAEDQIQFATGWSKYSKTVSTPDYYNSCSPTIEFQVPKSKANYQPDHRNCNAYAGLVTYFKPSANYREHIGIQLNQPLTIGKKYFLSFYTVMGEQFAGNKYFGMPSNNIGMRFSTIAYNPNNPCPIDNFAHIYSPTIINDSINWNRISGSIIADSAYNYLVLGNFFDDTHTDTLHYGGSSYINYSCYYFVDDVCVSTDSAFCNGGIDALPCTVSISEPVSNEEIKVFPNPANDFIDIFFENTSSKRIQLFDVLGKIVYSVNIKGSNSLRINLTAFPPNCYFLKVTNEKNNRLITKKIIKL